MAKQLTDTGHTSGQVAIIAGSMDEGKAPIRQRAFVDAVTAAGFEVVATEDVKWNPVTAETSAGQLLARYAGQGGIAGIYGMNDTLANSVIQAASAAGISTGTGPEDLVVVGGNCQAVGIENIEKGLMAATVLDLPILEGALAAQKAGAYFGGETLEKHYYLPPQPITADNVDAFAEDCSY
jgi:ABC-type sugar transport system substrate-binding protein